MNSTNREEMMNRLGLFLGHWKMDIIHPHLQPNPISGNTHFDWLEETYLVQHTQIDKAEFPNSTSIYDWDLMTEQYLMHYFDTRGVTRLYQMTLENGVWKLWRDKADFSPLTFNQRFTGTFDEKGTVIESAWEASDDGITWSHDFKIVYRKDERT